METGKNQKGGFSMFPEKEMTKLGGLEIFDDHIQVTCGCSSTTFGDAVGKLRVYPSGQLQITCECTPGCEEAKLTPAAFEKHSEREGAKKWKNHVWVFVDGDKVPLAKTPLLKYYAKSLNGKWSHRSVKVHRDEIVQCRRCTILRRFRMKSKEECRLFHDASLMTDWECALHPRFKCGNDEERLSRINQRGCRRLGSCKGCTTCVCVGCKMCRFEDCSCQMCVDFTKNASQA